MTDRTSGEVFGCSRPAAPRGQRRHRARLLPPAGGLGAWAGHGDRVGARRAGREPPAAPPRGRGHASRECRFEACPGEGWVPVRAHEAPLRRGRRALGHRCPSRRAATNALRAKASTAAPDWPNSATSRHDQIGGGRGAPPSIRSPGSRIGGRHQPPPSTRRHDRIGETNGAQPHRDSNVEKRAEQPLRDRQRRPGPKRSGPRRDPADDRWLGREQGIDAVDAYRLCSLAVDLPTQRDRRDAERGPTAHCRLASSTDARPMDACHPLAGRALARRYPSVAASLPGRH